MYKIKTKITDNDVIKYLHSVDDEKKREDCLKLLDIFKETTNEQPKLWGNNVIGFGKYKYKTKSGCEGEWFITGLAPRKQAIVLYMIAYHPKWGELTNKLGKVKAGKGCINIKKIEDVNIDILKELIKISIESAKKLL